MGEGTSQKVKPLVALARIILALALGILIPALVTSIAWLIRLSYDFPFSFPYMPALLFVAYLGGLLAGLTGAVVSTLFLDYFFVGPPGITLHELQADAVPSVLFLISGLIIAGAGDQYRRYQNRLRRDLMQAQRRERHERLVSAMTVEFARQHDVPALMDIIARRCTEFLGEWCAIQLVDADGLLLKIAGLYHRDAEKVGRLSKALEEAPLLKDSPVIAQILESPGPVPVYPDDPQARELGENVPAFGEFFTRLNTWGGLAVPIRFRGETIGLLFAGVETPRHWDVEDLRLATLIAERAGAAIQNARLTEARARAEQRLAIQYRVSRVLAEAGTLEEALPGILQAIGEGLGWKWAAFWFVDEDAGILRCKQTWTAPSSAVPEIDAISRGRTFVPGVGLPGRVWSSGQPAWIRDVTKDANFPRAPFAARDGLHGAFGFPVLVGDRVMGVAEFFSPEILPPDESLLRTVAVIGGQIGQFIERRRIQAEVRESEARKGAILDTAIDCIITMDHEGKIVEFNPAGERTFGYSRADVLGKEMAALIIPPSLRAQHRAGLARYLATGEGPVFGRRLDMPAMRADGTEFPVELSIVRIPSDGPPIFTGTLRDITERRRAEQAQRFLIEATTELSGSLDYETILQKLARLMVPVLADWCAIGVVEEDQTLRDVAIVHKDAAKVAMATELQRRYPRDPDTHPMLRVLRTGKAELVPDIPESLLLAVARDTDHIEAIRQVGARSYMIVPLIARGHTLGVITLVTSESGRRYGQEDLALIEEVARRAALAVDNARLYAAEQSARDQAEREARRARAIARVIAIAASAPDLGAVFDEFAEALQLLLPYTWVTVSLRSPTPDVVVTPYVKGPSPSARALLEMPAAGTAPGWVLDTQQPLVRHDASATDEFEEDRRAGAAGIRSYVIVPLSVGGRTIGTLNLGHHVQGFYTEEHVRMVQPIADQLAITISRFQLFDEVQRRAGELSETLQRALLPTELPKAPLMVVAALYRPADPEANIGGDWYDAALLGDDRVLLSVGDVAGHGVPAAAITGQVRNVIRAFALEERAPHEILMAANRFLSMLPESLQLSVWIGVFDPFSGTLAYAGAGHPPPYVVAHGRAQALDSTGPLLGISPTIVYEPARLVLEPGSRLIAYTDGLIEASRDILEGERRLQEAAVATAPEPPGRATEALLERVLNGGSPQDDIAVLVVDSLPVDAPLFFSLRAAPANLRKVRRAIRAYAGRVGISPERTEEVVIAVGEAALNVVEHAYDGRQGTLTIQGERQADRLMIIVRDAGRWRQPVDRGRGRGTRIIKGFTDSATVTTGPTGTVVEMTWVIDRVASGAP
ncbi:MAG: GAF domain-containing protein [Armatimonadota bacterium]